MNGCTKETHIWYWDVYLNVMPRKRNKLKCSAKQFNLIIWERKAKYIPISRFKLTTPSKKNRNLENTYPIMKNTNETGDLNNRFPGMVISRYSCKFDIGLIHVIIPQLFMLLLLYRRVFICDFLVWRYRGTYPCPTEHYNCVKAPFLRSFKCFQRQNGNLKVFPGIPITNMLLRQLYILVNTIKKKH